MAFVVITRLEFGRRVRSRRPKCKSNHRYPIFDGRSIQLLSSLLNNLGMGTELCVEGDHAKLIGLAAKLYSHYMYWQEPVGKY